MSEIQAVPDMLLAGGEVLALIDPISGEFVLPNTDPLLVREYLMLVAKRLLAMPGKKLELEVRHTFLEGMYQRELLIPKGTLLMGKIHKQACINIVSKGDIAVLTETGSARVKAGFSVVSPAGIQKLGYAHEDTIFVNVFRTDETDPGKIEDVIAWESYEAFDAPMIEGNTICA